METIEVLLQENKSLKSKIRELEKELSFLKTHPVFIQGLKGETIVCKLTGGIATKFASSYDVDVSGELKIEVKFSKLNKPNKSSTLRWNWSKPLGYLDKGKDYDFLLLLGDKDIRFSEQYPDNSPYVYFLIPRESVPQIMNSGKSIGANVQIISNLNNAKSPTSLAIKKHLTSEEEIRPLLESQIEQI